MYIYDLDCSLPNFIHSDLLIPTEYICLPNFLVAGSNVIEKSIDCTTFIVKKLYGWDCVCANYSLCLFDANDLDSAVGVWENNHLTLYQDISLGLLRVFYLVEPEQTLDTPIGISKRFQYTSFMDISSDGVSWQRCLEGKYGNCQKKKS